MPTYRIGVRELYATNQVSKSTEARPFLARPQYKKSDGPCGSARAAGTVYPNR